LPESVKSIGDEAFSRCENLREIEIKGPISEIPRCAFWGCRRLRSVSLSHLTQTTIRLIDYCAFAFCKSLEAFTLPAACQEIGEAAFRDCVAWQRATLPAKLRKIHRKAFSGCSVFLESKAKNFAIIDDMLIQSDQKRLLYCPTSKTHALIPPGVLTIADEAFRNCAQLESINLPDGLVEIGRDAFSGSALRSVSLPPSVRTLSHAFRDCKQLERARLPRDLRILGPRAFSGCTALTTINLSDTLQDVGEGAFEQCSALTNLNLPPTLLIIREYAFSHCSMTQKNQPVRQNPTHLRPCLRKQRLGRNQPAP